MDGITATMNGDTNVLIPALGDGTLDFSQLSPAIFKQAQDAAPAIEETAGYVFTNNTVPGGFYFNYSIPPWNDVRVRLALSYSQDRDGILAATDDTGRGGWHSPLSQIAPYWLDPKDLDTYGETFEGEPSGLTFHRDIATARQLLDAAGYPEGVKATLHGTADYGTTVVNLYEACASSASEAGFQFEFFFKEYAAYIASIFRGNFPDNWDGESSHLAIGPLYGGATDPEDIWAAVYARTSGRHNWGSAGRTTPESGARSRHRRQRWRMVSPLRRFRRRPGNRRALARDVRNAEGAARFRRAVGLHAGHPALHVDQAVHGAVRRRARRLRVQPVDAAARPAQRAQLIENADQRMWPKANYAWGAEGRAVLHAQPGHQGRIRLRPSQPTNGRRAAQTGFVLSGRCASRSRIRLARWVIEIVLASTSSAPPTRLLGNPSSRRG